MSDPIGKDDQLVMILKQKKMFRGGTWKGCLELDGGVEYSYPYILKLANDEPDTIVKVLKVDKYGKVEDITDAILDFSEKQP